MPAAPPKSPRKSKSSTTKRPPARSTPPRPTVSRPAVITAIIGTVVLALGAFVLSFASLTDLAIRAGIPSNLAWIWPLIVDGLIVVSTVAIVALAGHGRRALAYPWVLLIGGASVSIAANAMHAVLASDRSIPVVISALVASVPPVVLLAVTHLAVILIQRSAPPRARRAKARAQAAAAAAAQVVAAEPAKAPTPRRRTSRGQRAAASTAPAVHVAPEAPASPPVLEVDSAGPADVASVVTGSAPVVAAPEPVVTALVVEEPAAAEPVVLDTSAREDETPESIDDPDLAQEVSHNLVAAGVRG